MRDVSRSRTPSIESEVIHFTAFGSHVGESVEDVCQITSRQILRLEVPPVDGPFQDLEGYPADDCT